MNFAVTAVNSREGEGQIINVVFDWGCVSCFQYVGSLRREGVQTFLAPVGTVISTCPRRDLGLNIGLDLITRNPEGPISKTEPQP